MSGPRDETPVPAWAIQATEPSSVEVARLQARIRSGSESRSRGSIAWLVAAATAALLFALLPARYGSAPMGDVQLGAAPLKLGPSIVLTGEGALHVAQASRGGTVVQLGEGTVVAEVDPAGDFRALVVQAPGDVRVSVVGTRFRVSWSDETGGRVAVERGRVAVSAPGGARELGAGESWSWVGDAAAGEEPLERPVPGADDGAPGLFHGGDRPSQGPSTEAPVPSPAPEPAGPEAGSVAAEPGSTAPVPTSAPPEPSLAPAPPSAPSADPDAVAALDPTALQPGIAPAPEPASQPGPSTEPDIAQAKAFGRVQQAVEEGAYDDAAALADRFLGQWPGGALADEAGVLRIEALTHTSPRDAVRSAAAWLSAHPSHTRRADVLLLHASTANDALHDCASAIPSYDELTRLSAGSGQAKAFAFLGLCAAESGDADRARPAIDAALNHPDLPPFLTRSLRAARSDLSQESPR